MTDDIVKAESSLRNLGKRLREAWAKEQPLTQAELARMRQFVAEQWHQQQSIKRPPPPVSKPVQMQQVQARSRNQIKAKQEAEQLAPVQKKHHGRGHSH